MDKTVKMLFEKGKKLASVHDIDYSGKNGLWSLGFICPFTGAIFHNIQACFFGIYSRSQVSVYRTIGPLVLKSEAHSALIVTNMVMML